MNSTACCLTCQKKLTPTQWFCSNACVWVEIRRQEKVLEKVR